MSHQPIPQRWKPLTLLTSLIFGAIGGLPAFARHPQDERCVVLEVFVDQNRELDQEVEKVVKSFARERGKILLAIRPLQEGSVGQTRLKQITSHFKIPSNDKPLLYGLNRAIHSKATAQDYHAALENAFRLEVFVRPGCSRCGQVKRFLPGYIAQFPALELVYRDITRDNMAVESLNQLVARHQRAATSVPVIHLCDRLLIGFTTEQSIRSRLDGILNHWTKACPQPAASKEPVGAKPDDKEDASSPLALRGQLHPLGQQMAAVWGVAARLPFSRSASAENSNGSRKPHISTFCT
jgi:hypothetical protein